MKRFLYALSACTAVVCFCFCVSAWFVDHMVIDIIIYILLAVSALSRLIYGVICKKNISADIMKHAPKIACCFLTKDSFVNDEDYSRFDRYQKSSHYVREYWKTLYKKELGYYYGFSIYMSAVIAAVAIYGTIGIII